MLNTAIASNINNSLSIGKQVASGSRSSLLMSHIEFAPCDSERNVTTQCLQHKYHNLSGSKSSNLGVDTFNGQSKGCSSLDQNKNPQGKHHIIMNGNVEKLTSEDGVPVPKVQLYFPGRIHLEWHQVHRIGAGLANLGNTCFMNTVIQCLTYCPPLANCLLDADHASKCKLVGFCMMCELQKHMKRVLDRPGDVIKPLYIYQKLKSIAKHFQFGRQEDAHEFLRYVIDNLWKSCLANYDGHIKLDPASKETTVINQIFGGYHRSQVTCLRCKEKSNTYDHFMDFILDIKQNVPNLEKALEKFIQPELLQNDNAYKCPRCNVKVSAQKRFTVHRAPNVATFQFKRFDYQRMFGGKITKHVTYPEKLDLRPYMSDVKGGPVWYRLNAVLVHLGPTCNSGHYFCYVKNSNGYWYLMDDARVHQVSLNQVLNQQAYVLFYVRMINPDSLHVKKPSSSYAPSHKTSAAVRNGINGLPSSETPGTPVSRACHSLKSSPMPGMVRLSSSTSTTSLPNGTPNCFSRKSSLLPLTQNREKIAFGINRPVANINKLHNKSSVSNLQLNNSKIIPSVTKHLLTNNANGLVPYTGDSSESSDDDIHKMINTVNPSLQKSNVSQGYSPTLPTSDSFKNSTDKIKKLTHENALRKEEFKMGSKMSTVTESMSSIDNVSCKVNNERKTKISGNLTTLNRTLDAANSNSATASPATKTKATFPWNVTDSTLHSPSVASGSSTNSVNSTTDWNVIDQDTGARLKTEGRIFPGWSIKAKNLEKISKENVAENAIHKEKLKSNTDITGTVKKEVICQDKLIEGITNNIKGNSMLDLEEVSNENCKMTKTIGKFERCETGKTNTLKPDLSCNNSDCLYECCEDNVKKKISEGKQILPFPNTGGLQKLPTPERSETGTDSSFSKNGFRNQRKHIKTENSFLKSRKSVQPEVDRKQRDYESETKSSLKRTLCHVSQSTCEKYQSKFSHSNEDSFNSMSKKCKTTSQGIEKGKFRYKDVSRIDERDAIELHHFHEEIEEMRLKHNKTNDTSVCNSKPGLLNNADITIKDSAFDRVKDISSHKKTLCSKIAENNPKPAKKVATFKHEYTNIEPEESDSDTTQSNNSCDRSSSSASSNSSYEYEWVEKTKETIEAEKNLTPQAPFVKLWDSDIKDGYRKDDDREAPKSSNFHCDDSHKGNVVAELRKLSSHGYGAHVKSWQGNENSIDKGILRDAPQKRYVDEYDEELDKGKVKKKKYEHCSKNFHHKYNPFQKLQNMRNKEKTYSDKWNSSKHQYYKYMNDRQERRYSDKNNRNSFKRQNFKYRHNQRH